MEKINLGIISYAHPHAPRYAAAIVACPRADLTGIAGLGANPDLAAEEAERYGVPFYANYRELLARDDLTGVYIATEPRRHLEVVREAAARGKHILCDKPIALTLEEADEIIRLAREADVKLMVPFNPRFQLPVMKVKEALDSGQAGELVSSSTASCPRRSPARPTTAGWWTPGRPGAVASWTSASTPWTPCAGWRVARHAGYTPTSALPSTRGCRWTTSAP